MTRCPPGSFLLIEQWTLCEAGLAVKALTLDKMF